MRTAALIALLALAAIPATARPTPADAGTTRLADPAETAWVPFDLTPGNQIRFAMTLNSRAISAILDTGVSYSVISRRYAAANGLAVESAAGRASVIGGSVSLGRVRTATLAIGGMTRSGGTLAAVDLPAAATGSATAVDMLVGRDLTAPYALDIDYAGRRFRLLRSGRLPFTGTSSPLSIAPERKVYVSSLVLGGALVQPVVVDTGDGSAITLGAAAWRAARMPERAVTTTISYGLGGAIETEVAIVPAMVVGRTVARDVEVRIEPVGGFSDTIGVAGRVGSGFLQNYRVLLDPGAGHMLLTPGPNADASPPRSTSGLLLGLAGERLKVLHVMRGSPAAAGDWRTGDLICRVDGAAVTRDYAATPSATWGTGTPGRTIRLGLCDGTERTLTLRRFY